MHMSVNLFPTFTMTCCNCVALCFTVAGMSENAQPTSEATVKDPESNWPMIAWTGVVPVPEKPCTLMVLFTTASCLLRIQALIRRGQLVEGPEGPIVVCTRNDDLEGVVNATPEVRRKGVPSHSHPLQDPFLMCLIALL